MMRYQEVNPVELFNQVEQAIIQRHRREGRDGSGIGCVEMVMDVPMTILDFIIHVEDVLSLSELDRRSLEYALWRFIDGHADNRDLSELAYTFNKYKQKIGH